MRRSAPAAGPFPGAPSPINRLNGRYAVCTFAGIGALTAFDWEIEIRTEFVDGTAHGDIWDVPVPLKYAWTARVRGYYHVGDISYLHGDTTRGYFPTIGGTPADIIAASFVAYRDTVPTNLVFTGNGFLVRSRWGAPQAMVEQECEIRGVGVPTVLG